MLGVSGFPEDVYENVLYFGVNTPDTVEGRCDEIKDVYAAFPYFAGWENLEIRVYDIAGGQPTFQKLYPAVRGAGTGNPTEVAICLSYTASDDVDASTPRRRGRIYLGPLDTNGSGSVRPGAGMIDAVLDFGEALAQVGTASNTTWKMYSQRDNVTAKIEAIFCDNAWDTQRRRGLKPTNRTSRDVQ